MVGAVAWQAWASVTNTDSIQQNLCADAVVAPARDRKSEGAAPAVAGEVDLDCQPSPGPTEGVIVRFVLPVPPPFRPVAAA